MRNGLIAVTAAAMVLGSSSLAAFCQAPKVNVCTPQTPTCCWQCEQPKPKVIYRTKIVKAPAENPIPTPVPVQPPSITINVPPTNLEPLAVGLTLLGNAKMNETHTLENLGDLTPDERKALAVQYANARIKEVTAQATLTESQAGLNEAEVKFTNTKRKSYVALRVLDDLSGVAGQYLGATRITSNINNGSTLTGGNMTGGGASIANSGNGGGASIADSGNSSNKISNKATGTGGAGGAGGSTGPVTVTATGGGVNDSGNSQSDSSAKADPVSKTTNINNNLSSSQSDADANASAVAKQKQGQGQNQNQDQQQGQDQQQAPPPPPTNHGGKPPCKDGKN